MSRRTRTFLLTATNLLHPKVPERVTEKPTLKRQKAKWYHNRSFRSLTETEIVQDIRVAPLQKNQTWKTGTFINKLSDRMILWGENKFRQPSSTQGLRILEASGTTSSSNPASSDHWESTHKAWCTDTSTWIKAGIYTIPPSSCQEETHPSRKSVVKLFKFVGIIFIVLLLLIFFLFSF